MIRTVGLFFFVLGTFFGAFGHAAESAATTDALLERVAYDAKDGKPLVATVYVALCDNDSQGIIPVKNRSICNGDDPSKNIYWKGNGISGYLKAHGWRRQDVQKNDDGIVLLQEVWKKRLFAGKKLKARGAPRTFDAYIVAKAYRGSRIHNAMKDYLTSINTDTVETVTLDTGETINAAGGGHLIGYIGHDYFMDVVDGSAMYRDLVASGENRSSSLAKGTFALACISNAYVRPYVSYPNIFILAMNNFLTYPSAWTVGGIIEGVAAGGDGRFIYRRAAKQFAKGQKCGMKWALKAFSYGRGAGQAPE